MPSLVESRNSRLDQVFTQLQNFHGRRITNAADAINDQDYVTLAQLKSYIAGITGTTINNNTTISGGGGGGGVFNSIIQRVISVAGATTTIVHPAASVDGQILTVIIGNPASPSPPAQIAWDVFFSSDTPVDIDTSTAFSLARFIFVWSAPDSKWIYIASQVGGPI